MARLLSCIPGSAARFAKQGTRAGPPCSWVPGGACARRGLLQRAEPGRAREGTGAAPAAGGLADGDLAALAALSAGVGGASSGGHLAPAAAHAPAVRSAWHAADRSFTPALPSAFPMVSDSLLAGSVSNGSGLPPGAARAPAAHGSRQSAATVHGTGGAWSAGAAVPALMPLGAPAGAPAPGPRPGIDTGFAAAAASLHVAPRAAQARAAAAGAAPAAAMSSGSRAEARTQRAELHAMAPTSQPAAAAAHVGAALGAAAAPADGRRMASPPGAAAGSASVDMQDARPLACKRIASMGGSVCA